MSKMIDYTLEQLLKNLGMDPELVKEPNKLKEEIAERKKLIERILERLDET